MEVTSADQLQSAFKEAKRAYSDAVAVTLSPMVVANQKKIATLAAESRLPTIHPRADFVLNGGLMSYGLNFTDEGRDAARLFAKLSKA